MKTKNILTISLMLLLFSACHSKKNTTPGKELITQHLVLPSGESAKIIVSLDDDSTYYITIESEDTNTVILFHEEKHFVKSHYSYYDDSVVSSFRGMHTSRPSLYIVGEYSEYTWTAMKHHTIVDILARTDGRDEIFEPLTKVEFLVDNQESPTRIKNVVLWEITRGYEMGK